MGILSIFKRKPKISRELITAAQALLEWCDVRMQELERERQSKMQRQAELWSVMTPTAALQEDYRKITEDVADLILKQTALRERKEKISLAVIEYENTEDPERLVWLLKLPDPTLYVHYDVPDIKYSKG